MNQTDWINRGKKVLKKTDKLLSLLKNEIEIHFNDESHDTEELKDSLSERNLSLYFLCLSIVALFSKVIHSLVKKEWLVTITSSVGSLLTLPGRVWSSLCSLVVTACVSVWSLSWLGLPILCGIAMTVVTWYTIFLDKCVPGIFPPSQLSPKKSRIPLPQHLHLGHIIAIFNGIVVAALIYLGNGKGIE